MNPTRKKTSIAMDHAPAIPDKIIGDASHPFVQTVRLRNGRQTIGQAIWSSGHVGVVQLVHLEVSSEHGRAGHGGRLLLEVIRQAQDYQQKIGTPLRRMWVMLEQKSQVIARAFLTDHGFHHVGTTKGLYRDQDALIYMRAFD